MAWLSLIKPSAFVKELKAMMLNIKFPTSYGKRSGVDGMKKNSVA